MSQLKSRHEQELTAGIVSFSYINVLQGSVATQFRCGGIFVTLLQIFHRVCHEMILKIRQYLVKIWKKDWWHVFLDSIFIAGISVCVTYWLICCCVL